MKTWKVIENCPNFEVSSDGEVRGLSSKGKLLVRGQSKGSHGYLMVNLKYADEHRGSETVHTLVCRVFHGERPHRADACHIDGNKENNCSDNLRWGSRKENINDQKIHGTFGWHGVKKLQESDVLEISKSEELTSVLAKKYKVSISRIYGIRCGREYRELTGIIKDDDYFKNCRNGKTRGILNKEKVMDIVNRLNLKEKQKSIALSYGVTNQTISEIKRGKIWSWLTKIGEE